VRHSASSSFWQAYQALPASVRKAADKSFDLLKQNPSHPSLHFKPVGRFLSARIGLHHRALGVSIDGGVLWFWIGSHTDYERMIKY